VHTDTGAAAKSPKLGRQALGGRVCAVQLNAERQRSSGFGACGLA
jgi:hypothetical protein